MIIVARKSFLTVNGRKAKQKKKKKNKMCWLIVLDFCFFMVCGCFLCVVFCLLRLPVVFVLCVCFVC